MLMTRKDRQSSIHVVLESRIEGRGDLDAIDWEPVCILDACDLFQLQSFECSKQVTWGSQCGRHERWCGPHTKSNGWTSRLPQEPPDWVPAIPARRAVLPEARFGNSVAKEWEKG